MPQPRVMLMQGVPHRAIVSLLQHASTLCGVDAGCASWSYCEPNPMPQPSVIFMQGVPHRAILNLFQHTSTQCDVDASCAS